MWNVLQVCSQLSELSDRVKQLELQVASRPPSEANVASSSASASVSPTAGAPLVPAIHVLAPPGTAHASPSPPGTAHTSPPGTGHTSSGVQCVPASSNWQQSVGPTQSVITQAMASADLVATCATCGALSRTDRITDVLGSAFQPVQSTQSGKPLRKGCTPISSKTTKLKGYKGMF